MHSRDELELVHSCQKGDLNAFDSLMQLYEKKVYSLCYRMAHDRQDATDLAQEAFIKIYRFLPSFKGQSSFSTWLFRIVINTCLDERRRQAKSLHTISLDKPLEIDGGGNITLTLPGNEPDPLHNALEMEVQEEIQILLNMLPAEQRLVLGMRDLEGYSYAEIAETLNLNIGTVKSRLNRARARLRELYIKKEELLAPVLHLKERKGVKP